MVPYILAENPGMDSKQVFEISKRMMNGQKMETFILDLSFIGWALVAGITCGIAGVFYVTPYVNATNTELYAFNKVQALMKDTFDNSGQKNESAVKMKTK